jgi:hypothetical protein
MHGRHYIHASPNREAATMTGIDADLVQSILESVRLLSVVIDNDLQ